MFPQAAAVVVNALLLGDVVDIDAGDDIDDFVPKPGGGDEEELQAENQQLRERVEALEKEARVFRDLYLATCS